MIGLQCALCLHVEFLARENDQFTPPVAYATTLIDGTALCGLHVEDYDRSARSGGWLSRIAASILGLSLRQVPWGR